MSRPPKFNEQRAERVLEAIKAGATRRAAAGHAGIDETTLYRWVSRFASFADCLRAATRVGERARARVGTLKQERPPVQFLLPLEHARAERKRLRQAVVHRARLTSRVEFEQMLSAARACAVCGWAFAAHDTPMRRPVIDHDHQTGKVRGVICGRCNVGIGHLDDDPLLIARALVYLQSAQSESGEADKPA